MTFSDEHIPPALPFSGDETGEVFDFDDPVLGAPEINERVVDTQAGFLVIVRKLKDRLALSVKRRLGTPPSSSILLTPDESLSLSKILVSSISVNDRDAISKYSRSQLERPSISRSRNNSRLNIFQIVNSIWKLFAVTIVLIACLIVFSYGNNPSVSVNPLADKQVKEFTRQYVSKLLDFNQNTYKKSQIQAMSYMSDELLEKYWKETSFPLTKEQLKTLPETVSLAFTKIEINHLTPNMAQVDVAAELNFANKTDASPIHLKLKVSANDKGQLSVLEQKDLIADSL